MRHMRRARIRTENARRRALHRRPRRHATSADLKLFKKYPELNRRFVPPPPVKEFEYELRSPPKLNLSDRRSESLKFFRDLQDVLLHSRYGSVFVDLEPLLSISDSCAVMLAAELQRCYKYGSKKSIAGSYPNPKHDSYNVMVGLGVFDLLGVPSPQLSKQERAWFKIYADNHTRGEMIAQLREHFTPVLSNMIAMDRSWNQKFYRALTDATTNALDHAYIKRTRLPWMERMWWAAGIVSQSAQTLRFVFWDQGVGIPTTIRRKGLLARLTARAANDGELIDEATERGSSRFRDGRRGHGLYALIELIDLAPSGTLDIISGRGRYRYQKGAPNLREQFPGHVGGTLIVWTLRKP